MPIMKHNGGHVERNMYRVYNEFAILTGIFTNLLRITDITK